jgi:trigger factor
MKNKKVLFTLLLAVIMLAAGGCRDGSGTGSELDGEFSYSDGIDENGFWSGIRALDYVELFNYNAMEIPSEVNTVPESALQSEIARTLTGTDNTRQVFDRAIQDGDRVNIDFVGSIDGVEFPGGNSGGRGSDVIAGTSQFIDDFLWQIIGLMPGDVKDIHVNFPEHYPQSPDLEGQPALFVTTINYIIEENELTDSFIAENFAASHGWSTVQQMRDELTVNMQKSVIQRYVQDFIVNEVVVNNLPEAIVDIQERAMLQYYRELAEYYDMELEELISEFEGFSSVSEFVAANREENIEAARYYLTIQAIAESIELRISPEDLSEYFAERFGNADYSEFEEIYGLPYLKQVVIQQKVFDYIFDNAVLM